MKRLSIGLAGIAAAALLGGRKESAYINESRTALFDAAPLPKEPMTQVGEPTHQQRRLAERLATKAERKAVTDKANSRHRRR